MRHSNNVLQVLERMIRSAEGCNPERIIWGAIVGSGRGQRDQIIKESLEAAPGGRKRVWGWSHSRTAYGLWPRFGLSELGASELFTGGVRVAFRLR